jgi:hypothetical protein
MMEGDAKQSRGAVRDETLLFGGVQLRLASIVEMLTSQKENTLIQITRCAHW